MNLLTSTRLKAARACQRLHHLEYNLGYRPVRDADVLRFGGLVHLGLEAWWLAVRDGVSPDERLARALAAAEGEADPFDRARAEVLLCGYESRWGEEAGQYEVLGVEQRFAAPLRNPQTGAPSRTWQLGGKLDAVVRDRRDGRVLVVEHKTASGDVSPGSEYWMRLRMDGQVSVYFEGARSLGHDVAGCLYDVLAKPALRPTDVPVLDEQGVKIVFDGAGQRVKTKDGRKWRQTGDAEAGYALQTRPETPEEFRARLLDAVSAEPDRYFSRGEVVRLEQEMADALWDVWVLGQQIREAELAGRAPRNPDACTRWGRTCEFFGACTGAASLDDPSLFRRIEDVRPELSQEEAA